MAGLLKHGSDSQINGILLGAVTGVLVASSNISFVKSIVDMVMSVVPTSWNITGSMFPFSYLVFGVLGLVVGWFIDYK